MYRRGQPVEDMGEDAVEYEPSDQGDVIYQLGDKIRTQAKRLSSLEQYKLLCEKRILELCPGHELPVKQEHLGAQTGDSLRQQLYQAQQQIARLEQTIANSSSANVPANWPKEKQDLEESLRLEVLNSEKQRAYIETLKQALEVKMEGLGLRAPVEAFAQLSQRHENVDQTRREVERFKGVVKDQEAVIRLRESDLFEAKKTVNILKTDLDQLKRSLQQAQDDVRKLEIEKNTLLEYVQEQQQSENSLHDTINALKNEVKAANSQSAAMSDQLKDVKSGMSASQARGRQLEEQVQKLLEESTKAQLSFSQVKAALDVSQSKSKDLSQQLKTLSDQYSSLQSRHDSLQSSHSSLTSDLKAAKQTQDQLRLDLDSANKQRTYLQDSLRTAKDQLTEKESVEYRLRSDFKENQRQITNQREEFNGEMKVLTGKLEETRRDLTISERKLGELEEIHRRKVGEMEETEGKLKETHENTVQRYEEHIKRLENDLKTNKTESNTRLKAADGEIQHLSQIVREMQDSLKGERVEKEQFAADLRQSQLKLTLLTEDNASLTQELTDLKSDLSASKSLSAKQSQTIRSLQDDHSKAISRLDSQDRESARQQTVVKAMSEENEGLKQSLDALQEDLDVISKDVIRNAEELGRLRDALAASKTREQQATDELTQLRNYTKARLPHLTSLQSVPLDSPLLQTLIDLFSALESFQHTCDSLQKETDTLKSSVSSLTSELTRTHTDLAEVSKSEQSLKDQKSMLSHELDLVRTQMDQSHYQSTDHISRISTEMSELQRENNGLRDDVRELTGRLNELEAENDAVRETVTRLQYQIQVYEEKSVENQREKRALELLLTKITNCIPATGLKAVALDMLQVKTDILATEKAHTQARNRVADLEAKISYVKDPLETMKLQREASALEQTEGSLEVLRRRMQSLEMQLQETEENERRKTLEVDHFERMASDLQERLDRKSAELTQTQFNLLQKQGTPQRATSPYRTLTYESRSSPRPQSNSVQERLEQARSTINELKKLSRSGI